MTNCNKSIMQYAIFHKAYCIFFVHLTKKEIKRLQNGNNVV